MKVEAKRPDHTSHTSTEKPIAKVDFYRNRSSLDRSDVIQLVVQAPSVEEASTLFTEKLKELKLEGSSE